MKCETCKDLLVFVGEVNGWRRYMCSKCGRAVEGSPLLDQGIVAQKPASLHELALVLRVQALEKRIEDLIAIVAQRPF